MALVVSNYDEEQGFSRVRAVRARIVNVSDGEAPLPGTKAAAAAAAAGTPSPERVIGDFGVLSRYEADKAVTQVGSWGRRGGGSGIQRG